MAFILNKFFIDLPVKILQLKTLSWGAKGLWCYLLSRHHDDIPLDSIQYNSEENLKEFLSELISEGLVVYDKPYDTYITFWSTEECQTFKDHFGFD